MKKNSIKIGLVTVLAGMFMMVGSSAFAAIECPNMKVMKAGSKVIAGEQVNVVRVKRADAGACGTMSTTDNRTFNFAAVNGDAGLATALTAISLGQNVYMVLTNNDALPNTTVEIIQISAP